MEIRLIAFDLDGTLLREDKSISRANLAALEKAARQGIHIVPATGRVFSVLPQTLRELDFIRYYICINGAVLFDRQTQQEIYSAQIPLARTLELLAYIRGLPLEVIYDCYADNRGWTTQANYELADVYIPHMPMRALFNSSRQPVPDLEAFLRQRGQPVQKVQVYFKEPGNRGAIIAQLQERFPDIQVSSSLSNNLELNWQDAGKHTALEVLCRHLGIEMSQVLALGDGSNDIGMLEAAGVGVAMANATQRVRRAADCVTADNESDGVAQAIARYCF